MEDSVGRLPILLGNRQVACCGALQAAAPTSIGRVCAGVLISDFPALKCPTCGTAYIDVELGAMVEVAVAGLQGPLTMAEVIDRVGSP